jgi:hypothetical protein
MTPNLADAKLSALQSLLDKALRKADELLDDSDMMDPASRAKAIATAKDIHDYYSRELVRAHARQAAIEAARLLSGFYEGLDEVELGSWAVGHETDLYEHAQTVLASTKSVYL